MPEDPKTPGEPEDANNEFSQEKEDEQLE